MKGEMDAVLICLILVSPESVLSAILMDWIWKMEKDRRGFQEQQTLYEQTLFYEWQSMQSQFRSLPKNLPRNQNVQVGKP